MLGRFTNKQCNCSAALSTNTTTRTGIFQTLYIDPISSPRQNARPHISTVVPAPHACMQQHVHVHAMPKRKPVWTSAITSKSS